MIHNAEKIVPAIVIKSKFILPSNKEQGNYGNFLNYIDRKGTHLENSEFQKYQDYIADYMANEDKSTGLFTEKKDSLTREEKEKIKEIFKLSQEKGSILWQDVISFDNDWLKENDVLKDDLVDEKKLKEAARNAVKEMLKREGLEDTAIWTGAIHYNTDNIHIHIATVQTRDFIKRGKRKQSSLDSMKTKVAHTILDRSKQNEKLNDFIRNKVVNKKRNDDLFSLKNQLLNRNLVNQFLKIYKMLPQDKRLWNYSMNGLKDVRPEIDKFTTMYIEKHFKKEFREFQQMLDKEVEIYKRTYGDTKRAEKYRETKMNDLYKRIGNTLLKELKEYDKLNKTMNHQKIFSSKLNKIYLNREVNRFFFRINRILKNDIQHYKNQREYERFEFERERERELERD